MTRSQGEAGWGLPPRPSAQSGTCPGVGIGGRFRGGEAAGSASCQVPAGLPRGVGLQPRRRGAGPLAPQEHGGGARGAWGCGLGQAGTVLREGPERPGDGRCSSRRRAGGRAGPGRVPDARESRADLPPAPCTLLAPGAMGAPRGARCRGGGRERAGVAAEPQRAGARSAPDPPATQGTDQACKEGVRPAPPPTPPSTALRRAPPAATAPLCRPRARPYDAWPRPFDPFGHA